MPVSSMCMVIFYWIPVWSLPTEFAVTLIICEIWQPIFIFILSLISPNSSSCTFRTICAYRDVFCWIVIIFSNIDEGGSHCPFAVVVSCYGRRRPYVLCTIPSFSEWHFSSDTKIISNQFDKICESLIWPLCSLLKYNMFYVFSSITRILSSTVVGAWCFYVTFNNISVISWRSVVLVEESGENHRFVASHRQTLSILYPVHLVMNGLRTQL